MQEKQLKVWHLILAVAVQLVIGGVWAGQMSADVKANKERIIANEADIKRIDADGPSVWRTAMKFSDKEAEQVKRDLEAVRAELQTQRQLLVQIEQQLKP